MPPPALCTSFHGPCRMPKGPFVPAPWEMKVSRAGCACGWPSSAGSTFMLSSAASAGSATPVSAAKVAHMSVSAMSSRSSLPAGMRPGQRAMKGTRCPPSNCVPLKPRSAPLHRCSRIDDAFVAVLDHAAIVAGENDERLLREAEPVERREHLADGVVEFGQRFAAGAALARAFEARMRRLRGVDAVRGEVEEKRARSGAAR